MSPNFLEYSFRTHGYNFSYCLTLLWSFDITKFSDCNNKFKDYLHLIWTAISVCKFFQSIMWLLKVQRHCGLCNPSYWDGGIWFWLVHREPYKGSKWPAEGLHYTWGSTRGRQCPRVPLGTDWIPIFLGLHGCLVSSQALGSIPGSQGVSIDPDMRQNPWLDTHFLPSGRCPFKQNKTNKQN